MDCQINCQADGYAKCEGTLQGGCQAACDKPQGALFCDGEYVDDNGNLQSCIDALDKFLKEHVDASASGSCTDNSCTGEAQASCKCSTPARGDAGTPAGLAAAAFAALAVAARRRRR
jgi:MYXO-CTERM domain-containing protein